jgi:tRNA threonylcarbamoyladenosine biosynthesis protein TsaE
VAAELSRTLVAGDVVLLSGDLGAGKTAFVRGLAEGLGVDPGEVSSPTFTLLHEYRGGRLPLFHADLYRLDRVAAEDIGLDDPAIAAGVLAVEWPDRLARMLSPAVFVRILATAEETRLIDLERFSDRTDRT